MVGWLAIVACVALLEWYSLVFTSKLEVVPLCVVVAARDLTVPPLYSLVFRVKSTLVVPFSMNVHSFV